MALGVRRRATGATHLADPTARPLRKHDAREVDE
jgi:hypothetical protein